MLVLIIIYISYNQYASVTYFVLVSKSVSNCRVTLDFSALCIFIVIGLHLPFGHALYFHNQSSLMFLELFSHFHRNVLATMAGHKPPLNHLWNLYLGRVESNYVILLNVSTILATFSPPLILK